MSAANVLLKPEECAMLLVDFQAGLGFGVESIPRQLVVNKAVGLARTAVAFKVPVIASTSASRVYSGPFPALQEALPADQPQATDHCGIPYGSLCVLPSALGAEGWLRSVRCWRRLRRLDPTEPRTRPPKIGASRCSPDKLDTDSFGIPA